MIELRDVHKSFGSAHVLRGVSLDIPMGACTALIGPSGTGKSVLLKHLVGLHRPDQGSVRCFGVDMGRASEATLLQTRKRFGMLFQDGALFQSLSVGENVAFPLRHHHGDLAEAEIRRRVARALEQVELDPASAERSVTDLSGGERKRVGLARAIVHRPEVLLFDEPNSGLDPVTSDAIDKLILRLKGELGMTFVIISHDILGVMRTADQVGMLHDGGLIAYGPTPAFIQDESPLVRAFLSRSLRRDPDGHFLLPSPPEL